MNRLILTEGTHDDYAALRAHHYEQREPGTIARILRASEDTALAGVLVVSYPALNDNWRERAFGPLFAQTRDSRSRAASLNQHVRCISRVIIAPRFRALGVATALVRHYLAQPLTALTEAVSALNAFIPLFARAGMTPLPVPEPLRDLRLKQRLRDAGLSALDLATLSVNTPQRLSEPTLAELRRALEVWGRAHRGTRGMSDARSLARAAARALLMPRQVFVAGTLGQEVNS